MKKLKKVLILAMMLCMLSPVCVLAAKTVTPKTTVLTDISAPAYNKINIRWKKASGATHYKIYYRKSGTKKWNGVKTVSSRYSSYTHTSSKSDPIVVGQKYDYTVKAYNSKYKTYGKYNSKGLTAATKPSTIKLKSAKLNSNKTVTVSWSGSKSCDYYKIYRKTGGSGWKNIATVKSNVTSYTDKKPVTGTKNYYTVRAYYSKTKAYGSYNTKGVGISVPGSSVPNVEKLTISPNLALLEKPGDTETLSVKVFPNNASKSVTWKSSDTDVVTVHHGKLTAVSKGTATVTATATDGSGVKGECDVFVLNDDEHDDSKVYHVVIDSYVDTFIYDGDSTQLKAHVEPSTAANQGILWDVEVIEGSKSAFTIDAYGVLTAHGKLGERAVARVYAKAAEDPSINAFIEVTMNISEDTNTFPEEVLRLTNAERAKRGIPPVQYHAKLQQAAMIRAKELEIKFSHIRPSGESAVTALWEVGVGGGLMENIASGQRTPAQVIDGWMHSGGHRAAILDRSAKYLGVGFYEDISGKRYWVQMFVDEPDVTYTLSFNTMGGSNVEPIQLHKAEKLILSTVPTPVKSGYQFGGWYLTPQCNAATPLNSIIINLNRTIYAKWIPE